MGEDLTYKSCNKWGSLPNQILANSLIRFVSLLSLMQKTYPWRASLPHFHLPSTKGIN